MNTDCKNDVDSICYICAGMYTVYLNKSMMVKKNPGGDEIFRPSKPALGPTQPPVKWVPGLSPGVKCGRGVLLTPHPLPVPRSWNSRAIPLPTLWAILGL